VSTGEPWAVSRVYEVLRMPIELASDRPEVGPILDRICAEFPTTSAAPIVTVSLRTSASGHAVWVNEERRSEDLAFDQGVMKLMSVLHAEAMARCSLWSIHAGVVSRSGRAAAFPGRSGVGKSTLVGACVRLGWDYVSDEALSFDPDTMEVVPYPKPLWLDGRAADHVDLDASELAVTPDRYKYPVTPTDLGGRVAGGSVRLAWVILIDRSAPTSGVEPLRRAELATLLLRNTFRRTEQPERNFAAAVAVASQVEGHRLCYRDPLEGARLLDTLVE